MDNLLSALENLNDKFALQQKDIITKHFKAHNTMGDFISTLKVSYSLGRNSQTQIHAHWICHRKRRAA